MKHAATILFVAIANESHQSFFFHIAFFTIIASALGREDPILEGVISRMTLYCEQGIQVKAEDYPGSNARFHKMGDMFAKPCSSHTAIGCRFLG